MRKLEGHRSSSLINMKTRGFDVVLRLKTKTYSPFKQLESTI